MKTVLDDTLDFFKEKDHSFKAISIGIVALIVFITVCFYVQYASIAWFFQDDFDFLHEYQFQHHADNIFGIQENFGRFLSRNVYWFGLQQLFGHNSALFYLFNLVIIFTSSFFIYKLVSLNLKSKTHSVLIAFIYLCAAPTIESYSWLSNSQHLLVHLFVFCYLYLASKSVSSNIGYFLPLLLVYILGIYSNILMIFVLPLHFLIKIKQVWTQKLFIAYFSISVVIALYFIIILSSTGGAYTSNYSFEQFMVNLSFYTTSLYQFNFSSYLVAFYLILLPITLKKSLDRGNHMPTIFLVASMLFFIPFAFLENQKYLNYIALTYFFFWASLATLMTDRIMLTLLLVISVLPSIHVIKYFSNNPRGAEVKVLVDKINDSFESSPPVSLCITPYEQNLNTTDVKVWDIPAIWWFLGFGQANKIFNYNHIKVELMKEDSSSCDVVWVVNRDFRIVKRNNL